MSDDPQPPTTKDEPGSTTNWQTLASALKDIQERASSIELPGAEPTAFELSLLDYSSPEAEQAVLGSCFLRAGAFDEVAYLEPSDFFLVKHRWIWNALLALPKSPRPNMVAAVAEELMAHGQLEEVGGVDYLKALAASVPTTIHAEGYARLVRLYASRRRMLEVGASEASVTLPALSLLAKSIENYEQTGDPDRLANLNAVLLRVANLINAETQTPEGKPSKAVRAKESSVTGTRALDLGDIDLQPHVLLGTGLTLEQQQTLASVNMDGDEAQRVAIWLLGLLIQAQRTGHELAVVNAEDEILLRVTL